MRCIFYYSTFLFIFLNSSYGNDIDSLKLNKYNSTDSWKMSLLPSMNIASMGQLNNGKPIKALSLTALKVYWYKEFLDAHESNHLSDRSRAFWWFLFLYFYSIIDASIDSEMESFPLE